jgi:TPR repeat protein
MMVIGDTGFTPGFDAILGAPFLLQMDMLLDLPAKRLRLYKPQDCDKNALLLWDEPTVVLPFTYAAKDRANPHFTVLVNGKTMDAAIDSGAHHSVMTLDAAKRAGLDVQGPGATRLRDVAGIGTDRAPHWSVPVQTVQIGDETVRDAEIGVVDSRGSVPVDMFLGQDFLRAHRVLFAMSQKKLYVAYVGGNAFTRSTGVEPWMQQEAEAGNADAQYVLSTLTGAGRGTARDAAQAEAWLQKAALQGQPHAKLALGRRAVQAGDAASAIPQLRAALDALPAERYGPLWLYLARLRNGEAELARTELAAHLKAQQDDDWPTPIAQFYLGKWDAARLLQEAGADKQTARNRGCQAERYIAEWHAARGDADRAAAMKAAMAGRCGRDGG